METNTVPSSLKREGVTTMGDACRPVEEEVDTTSKRPTYSGGIAHQVRRDSLKGEIYNEM